MIAAIAINHLLENIRCDDIGVAYLYCNYKVTSQTATDLFAAVLKQLVQSRKSIPKSLEDLFKNHVCEGTKPSLDEVFDILLEVLVDYSTAYLVIDALDECTDRCARGEFLRKLRVLQYERELRIMVTSRFIPEILDEFESIPQLEIRASKSDVSRFVRSRFHLLPRFAQRDGELHLRIEEAISEAVDGM